MWDWTPAARRLLRGGHTAASRVDVLHAGKPVYTLEVTGGRVTIDADRPVRANLACTLTDPTGRLSRGDVDDLLNPYDCEIQPWRGVEYGPRTRPVRELAPLGVFGLTARNVRDTPDGLAIGLAGQDRAMGYQGPMTSALAIPDGTPVETAIARLLATRNPGLSLLALDTGFTCGPLLYAPDIDVWAEARKLAESVGARLFHDRTGQCVLALAGPASDRPVAAYAEGGGLLLDVDRSEDSDTIANVVVAESPDGRIRAVARDEDTTSPTYYRGRYGEHPADPLIHPYSSVEQALQAATARLAYELGRSETVLFTAVPDSGRYVDEVVTVHRPRSGLDHRGVVVATIDMPLGVTEHMSVGCRQSRLAQDGRDLGPVQELAA